MKFHKLLLSLLITVLCFSSVNAQQCLLAYYPFSTNALDVTNNGNDGTVFGATLTNDRFGSPNSAYYFNGINNYISIPPTNFLLNEFTYSLWAKPNSMPTGGNYYAMLSVGGPSGNDQHMLLSNDFQFSNFGWSGGGWSSGSPFSIDLDTLPNNNEWSHIVLVRSTSEYKLYVNGMLNGIIQNNGLAPSYSTNPVASIGARIITLQRFHGDIDDVKIFGCALADNEILELYNEVTSVNELSEIAKITLYPNPTNDKLTISAKSITWKDASISLYNSFGQIVLEENVNSPNSNEYSLDVNTLSAGVYQLVVLDDEKRYSAKVLVE